jgi:hypothetical protein
MKTCKACGLNKPYSEYRKRPDSTDNYRNQCKSCESIYNKNRYQNPEYVNQHRSNQLKRRYGISLVDYETMLFSQNGACAICKSESPNKRSAKHFMVDHDHETGSVRGLLCHPCNTAIGLLGDNVLNLESAINYLSTHA